MSTSQRDDPAVQAGGTRPDATGPAGEIQILSEEHPPPSQLNDAIVIGLSILAGICGIVFGVALTLDAPMPLYGGALAIGLFALAYAVRRYFVDRFPDVEAIEPRLQFSAPTQPDEDQRQSPAEIPEVQAVGRRPLLRNVLLGSAAAFGVGLLAPISTLGPAPGGRLRRTAWERGTRLQTTDGEPLRPDNIPPGGVSTVWPEGAIGNERASVVLIRLDTEPLAPTVLDWVVDNRVLAYSKVCTHAGCPVALYREQDEALFCPCHQSTFDARRGAIPTFGPAARPLPQLPLGVDSEGYLVALADFQEPVGPAFG